jgi:transcription elongation factor Elf1
MTEEMYVTCPKCNSKNIHADSIDAENFYRDVYCENCGFQWIECFEFSGNIFCEEEE